MADSGEGQGGRFHPKCSPRVVLSEDRRVARGLGYSGGVAFSNDPIPIGLQFSVKILHQGARYVRKSAQRILQTSPISRTFHG